MGTISEKLAHTLEQKNQIKLALNTPDNVLSHYAQIISKYVKNQPKSIVEGSSAICENAVDLPCNIDINGNSYQETTEGYNQLRIDYYNSVINTTITNATKESIEVETIDYTQPSYLYFDMIGLKAGITYKAKCLIEILKGTVADGYGFGQLELYKGGAWISVVAYYNFSNFYSQGTFTVDEDGNYRMRFLLTNKALTESLKVKLTEFMVYDYTSQTDKPYEPYTNGASPNTEYKQDIEVIGAYNLLNLVDNITTSNGITTTVENETMALSGKATAGWCNLTSASNKMKISLKANTKYTFVRNQNLPLHVVCRLYFEDNTYQTVVIEPNRIYIEFTPTNDVVSCYLYIGGGLVVDTEYSFTNLKYIIYEGNYDANKLCLPHECIGLLQQNKNMFSLDKAILKGGSGTGVTLEDKKITMSGIYTWSNSYVLFKNPKKNGYISVSADFLETAIASKKGVSIYGGNYPELKDITNLISVMPDVSLNTKKRIGAGANTGDYKYILIRFWDNATATNLTTASNCVVDNIQMEFGEPTEYVEHQENLIPIDLQGNTLAKVGDIKDFLKIGINGSVKLNKNINIEELTGNEAFDISTGEDFIRFSFSLFGKVKNDDVEGRFTDIMTNYFRTSIENGNSICFRYRNQIFLYSDGVITTLEDITAWVKEKYNSGNPLKIMYQRAETEVIDLPSIKPIELFEGTNIFELVTNLDTTMSVEYIVNAESLQNEITELTNAVIELGGSL